MRYYYAHPEKMNQGRQRRRAMNPEEEQEKIRRYRSANRDKYRDTDRRYRLAHPEQKRDKEQRRRARKRELPATLTREQWAAILAAFKHKCAYCGAKGVKLQQDHVTPVSKGGGYTVENIVPACKSCNSKKRDKEPPRPVQTLLL